MNLNHIAVFVETIHCGSITKAAKALNKPKSTISRQLTELEEKLSVKLVHRTTRHLAMTEAGETLFRQSQGLIRELNEIQESIGAYQRHPKGQLKLLWPQDLFPAQMSEMISEFLSAWTQVELFGAQYSGALPAPETQYDLQFFLHQHALPSSDWIARPLMSIPNELYVSNHMSMEAPKSLMELSSYACILQTGEEEWLFRKGRETIAVPVSGRLILNSPDMRLKAAVRGQGVTRLPQYLAEPLVRKGALKKLTFKEHPMADRLTVMYRNRQLPLKTRLFLEHFQSHLGRLYNEL